MAWIRDQGPDPVPTEVLDRINYLGVPSTGPGGAHFPPPNDGPQAYLAVQGSGVDEIPVHFHSVEQFQYVVGGSGVIGSRRFDRGILHYADRFTPYGPIGAGSPGLTYVTLRPCHDTGVFVMPEGQDRLTQLLRTSDRPTAHRRQHAVDLVASRAGPEWTDICEAPDGLRMAVVDVPAGAPTPAVTAGGAGAFLLVANGTMEDDDGPCGAGAIRWCANGEPVAGRAGTAGARLALLQFPVVAVGPGPTAQVAPASLA